MTRSIAIILPLAIATATSPVDAACLRIVSVPVGDELNLREAPNASAAIVQAIRPHSGGVLLLKRPCSPASNPKNQQWCRVRYIEGTRLRDGFVLARFVELTRCP